MSNKTMASKGRGNDEEEYKKISNLQKSYFDVLGLCCSSEVPLIEKILKPLDGVVDVSVIVPSRTVIVVHDIGLITQDQIVKALNQARLEANVRLKGKENYKAKWPNLYVILCGLLLGLSFLKCVYHPLQWLAVVAVAIGIWPVILRGVVAIRNLTLDVNILVLIAVVGTIALRDYVEAGTIVFLFTIAEWLESRASQKATAVMSSLLNMAPQKATIADTGEVVNVEDVKLNSIIAVKAGEMIPIDGTVVEGTCEVDEKTLTGESYPVAKQKESNVWAGTVNVNGYISVKTTALAEDCAVAKMARLVEEAQNNKSSVQRLIDKWTNYYTPAVILMSAGLAVVPAIMKVHNLRHWLYLALVVLVSACPCGLILSTPVATFCALSRSATTGLLIKGGDYLEILAKVKVMAFDKTGTITRGEFTMMNFLTLADDVSLRTLLYWVSSIESKSSHPIASVLVDYAKSQAVEPKPDEVEAFQDFPGEGVFGRIDGREFYIGNKKLAQRANYSLDSSVVTKEGRTPGYIYSGGTLIGSFSLSDNCRSGAVDAIKELKAMGIRTALLTGDGQSAAMYAQKQLGNILDDIHAELLPVDKARIITDYKKEGATSMVGDGVNDAPALATADVGISMGVSGSALATETGHVILMSNDIRKIPKAIKLARKARQKVIQNIIISIVAKAGVLASAFAWHPIVWLAVLVDVGTCLIVILNSMLLLREDHAHGGKRCGLFSCQSHKSKCHSTSQHSKMHQQCCTKSALPKACESARCSSNTNATPCQTSTKCHTTSSMKNQQCCASSCEATKHTESDSHPHHLVTVHDLHEDHCTSHERNISDSPTKIGHSHHQHSPCRDGQCLDALESQVSCGTRLDEGIRCEDPLSECCHEHSEHSQNSVLSGHQHGQIICCENKDGSKDDCVVTEQKYSGHVFMCEDHGSHDTHHHSVKEISGHCHKENNVLTCENHCPTSHEIHDHEHHHHHHHHQHSIPHGTCHSEAVAKHACMSLRKRELGACCKSYRRECCSSQGKFAPAFGGLTEIVSE